MVDGSIGNYERNNEERLPLTWIRENSRCTMQKMIKIDRPKISPGLEAVNLHDVFREEEP